MGKEGVIDQLLFVIAKHEVLKQSRRGEEIMMRLLRFARNDILNC